MGDNNWVVENLQNALSTWNAKLQEIWQLLLRFAPYVGVGIKTTLGMGGVQTAAESRYNREE